jgi:3-deoxy-D-manno-octulosonic-acid transferase
MIFYNFGIYLYGLIVSLIAPFHKKAKVWKEGRKAQKDNWPVIPPDKRVVWMHCASLGEYEQGKPVLEWWQNQFPNDYLLVTFFSPSGYQVIKNQKLADATLYLPLDTPKNAAQFIQHFQPKITFFVKYEFWLNMLNEAKKQGSDLYLMSAIFRSDQAFFKWYGGAFLKTLKTFDWIFVQNVNSLEKLTSINVQQASLAGDTRYDRVYERSLERNTFPFLANWLGEEKAFILGSTWSADENITIDYLNKIGTIKKVILAPHEVDEQHILEVTSKLKIPFQRFTEVEQIKKINDDTQIIVVDCIGKLADLYRYSDIAYVGGGFGTGLHNILEPAVYGSPVLFGPEIEKFPEAKEFVDKGIGFIVENALSFELIFQNVFNRRDELQILVKEFMEEKRGAKKEIVTLLSKKYLTPKA